MLKSKTFRFAIWILLLLTIVWVGKQISFIFEPIAVLVTTLFFPIVVAGVLYYILGPVVNLLHRWRIPRSLATLLIYLGGIGVITGLVLILGPILQKQFNSLVEGAPSLINELSFQLRGLLNHPLLDRFQQNDMLSVERLTDRLSGSIGDITSSIGSNLASIFNVITNIVIGIVVVPFILFYMLKDGNRLSTSLLRFVPKDLRSEGSAILEDLDDALSGFIQGQMIVSLFIGTFVYIWYIIIDLDYSLILALIALFTNVIPFVGPIIGTAPGVIVGLIQSPLTALWVIIGVVVIQQIESNLISPQVMGRKLDIHPLTIILLLLVAGSLAGLVGMIFAIPVYATLEVVAVHTYRLIELRNRKKQAE